MIYNPYSISKIGTYAQCPKKFDYLYIQKLRGLFSANKALYKGSYIHWMLEHGRVIEVDSLKDIPKDMEYLFDI